MKLLTLTPEVKIYAVAILAIYCVSCGELTQFLTFRLPLTRRVSFMSLYATIMAVVVIVALLVLDLPGLTRFTWPGVAWSLLLGIASGTVAWRCERAVKNYFLRRNLRRLERPATSQGSSSAWVAGRMVGGSPRMSFRTTAPRRAGIQPEGTGAGNSLPPMWPDSDRALPILLVVGALEEVLFRGVLVDLLRSASSFAVTVVGLATSVVLFSLSHTWLGHREVLAKLPLGLLSLGAALAMGHALPAVVAHVLFNFRAWQAMLAGGSLEAAR